MGANLIFFRNLSIFVNLFSVIQLLLSVILPDILDPLIKTWVLVILGVIFLGLTASLILANTKDTITLEFLVFLSAFISGVICGISLLVIIGKVKNGGFH
jgi:hypothetical protein